ncbi:hypothetical protein FKW77_002655 [Venturia effusa]|uniref:Uncharacterized protein n=1 Tax=Venturia effusa TaxID=50376 RepID=A0A517L0Y3_9PEZI|nr:hypothetical protein FKW77_002655 [Venturia effusa]
MLTLESLPRELRQEIFRLAFEDAINRDIHFNHLLRNCIQDYESFSLLRCWWVPDCLVPTLDFPQFLPGNRQPKYFAPSIHDMAACLNLVFSDVIDDVDYVLYKALTVFTGAEERALNEFQAKARYGVLEFGHAVAYLAARAKARNEMYDRECGAGIQNTGNLTPKQILMVDDFQGTIDRMQDDHHW